MLRIFTENSSEGTQAGPWLDKTAGGKESAMSRIDKKSKGLSFLNLIHPLLSDRSDKFPDSHLAEIGSKRTSN